MTRAPEDKRDPLIGRVIAGKFAVEALLGVGAMGRVYRAHHAALDKTVAVKVLNPAEPGGDPQMLSQRFKAEARAASRLDHPNSVQILDFGEDGSDKLLYIAMELLQGQNLGAVLKRVGKLSSLRACNIMVQVLAALGAAHRAGVVHRDLKPANIMLVKKRDDEGEVNDFVKVCDFGIAKVMDTGKPDDATAMTMTKQGAIFGTPAYMSPEQARGEKVDFRTDIYSCGVILYRMIGGKTPFQAETAMGLLTKLMTEEPQPLNQLASTIDPRLEAIVAKALAKDRQQRFAGAVEMRTAIKELMTDDGLNMTVPPPTTAPGHATQPPAHFQTLTGGSWKNNTGTWTGTGVARAPEVAQPFTFASLKVPLIAVGLIGVLAGIGWAVYDRIDKHGAVPKLAEQVGMGSFGVAENMFNERFAEFSHDPAALSFIPEILRQRRAAEKYESRLGIPFDANYVLSPSSWIGTYQTTDQKRAQRFICTFESIDGPIVEGYLEWPDVGLRAALHGIKDGNHLVLWDYALSGGSGPDVKRYTLNDKKNILLTKDGFEGLDGPFQARVSAKLSTP